MNDVLLPANIGGFASEAALVNRVRMHYWVGGNPNGLPVLLLASPSVPAVEVFRKLIAESEKQLASHP